MDMSAIYLHDHPEFSQLLNIIGEETNILPGLIEKDYWIMHSLYGLQKQGYQFQLKGGTSLSKGFEIINRFSEDIDIHISPPKELEINENPKNNKPNNIQKKKGFYDQLSNEIKIDGITNVIRDVEFDDLKNYNSGGIRLYYQNKSSVIDGLKEGILLEVGFDIVSPNLPKTISSWAYEKAKTISGIEIIDNRAKNILCYDYRYTFVEKLQTIATKFRKEMETGINVSNYMRQYYDVFSLLGDKHVLEFIGTEEYHKHKQLRFPKTDFDTPIDKNEAFLLTNLSLREQFHKRYIERKSLYYKGQPHFDEILKRLFEHIDRL